MSAKFDVTNNENDVEKKIRIMDIPLPHVGRQIVHLNLLFG